MIVKQSVVGKARVRLQQQLGSGASADAYLAQLLSYEPAEAMRKGSRRPPKQLVVKLQLPKPKPAAMSPDSFVERVKLLMSQEHRVLHLLSDCDAVINTYGFGMAAAVDGSSFYGLGQCMPCILLEYAALGDLWQQLQPSPSTAVPMNARTTQDVMLAVLRALMALNRQGYIHKDIKPHNVLVCQKPGTKLITYKVCDFGLAAPAVEWSLTDGEGTPAFKPPDYRWLVSSDIYSLGRLFLACRSGAAPQMGTFQELQASGVYDSLPDPLRKSEWDLLRVCLEEDGVRREGPSGLLKATSYFYEVFF